MIILSCILLINFVLSMLYVLIKMIHRKKGVEIAIFFIFLPGFGFVIYYLPILLQLFKKSSGVDKEALLTHIFDIERQSEHPDIREELNVVPIEDAMAISGNTEKRALLLKQLKKNLKENYKILLAAEEDEDSESVHYVAAAKMEIYRLLQIQWLECRRDYEQEPDNPEKYHTACAVLAEILDSDVFSTKEQNVYQKQLCNLVQKQIDGDESIVTLKEYESYLSALVELAQYDDAQRLWEERADHMRSEIAYQTMLKMFYQMKNRQKFEELINDLRKNNQVRLSCQGLEQLRYWIRRLNRTENTTDRSLTSKK